MEIFEPVIDKELQTLAAIQGMLEPLSQREIERVLKYLLSRYEADTEVKHAGK